MKGLTGLAVMFAVVGSALVGGCAQPGAKRAVSSMVDTRVELVKAQNDLYQTLQALDQLQKTSGDVRPAYAEFTKAMQTTERQAAMIASSPAR